MSFQATVFNVMIASPSDVPVEREIVREIVYEWNAEHADERGIVLLPVGWETHSAPDSSGPAQSVINRQVLENSDLLVGIFWTRIGTATEKFASGAVEELETHIAAGKPAMLYFSEAPVAPSQINNEQYQALEKFRESCKHRSLYFPFAGPDDFKSKFRRHLGIRLKDSYFKIEKEPKSNQNSFTQNPVDILSDDEKSMLIEVSRDSNRCINKVRISAGFFIETNRKQFVERGNPRSAAKWSSVLNNLVAKQYIIPLGHKGELFELTEKGYIISDLLTLE